MPISGMIRTPVEICAETLVRLKDNGKTAAETANDEIVIGALYVLSEFFRLVSQQYHSKQLLPYNMLYQSNVPRRRAFLRTGMLKSAKAKANTLLATEFHQLRERHIDTLCAALAVHVHGTEKINRSKYRQFQVHLYRIKQGATKWSVADR